MAIYITGDIHGNPERITRQQIIDLFYKLPQDYDELYDFKKALKNGEF